MPRRRGKDTTKLLRGTLFTLRRRCGKANCRCAEGDAHESPALAYPEGGRTKTLSLTNADLDQVRSALDRYERARSALDTSADAGIAELRASLRRGRS